jgi:hypothetical protein
MATEGPSYTTVPGRIPELLKKIRETGVPPKATNEWLRSVGFSSSNDRSLLRVLRQIGFVDTNGVPQPAWREYRGADHREVLGRALVLGYDMLYATYPDAHARSATDLGHVISTKTSAGKQAVDKTVATFKNLVKEARFDSALPDTSRGEDDVAPNVGGNSEIDQGGVDGSKVVTRTVSGGGVTVNINVQLTIPETTDDKVFEAFFRAMRTHLIDDSVL